MPKYLKNVDTGEVYPWSQSWSKWPNMEPYDGKQRAGFAVDDVLGPAQADLDEGPQTPVEPGTVEDLLDEGPQTPVEPSTVEDLLGEAPAAPAAPAKRGRLAKGKK